MTELEDMEGKMPCAGVEPDNNANSAVDFRLLEERDPRSSKCDSLAEEFPGDQVGIGGIWF